MKKTLSLLTITSVLGLGLLTSKVSIDLSQLESKEEGTTFIVQAANGVEGRNRVLNEIAYRFEKGTYEIGYTYDTLYNGFSITVDNDRMAQIIKDMPSVLNVNKSHTWSRPEVEQQVNSINETLRAAAENEYKTEKLSNYSAETMQARAEDVIASGATSSQGGKGVTIGIMDTGLFLNQVEGTDSRAAAVTAATKGGFTLNAPAFKDLTADKLTESSLTQEKIEAAGYVNGRTYTWINNKVPFSYDIANNDANVDPNGADMNHGTHVASIAAANGDEFNGIAPNAQLAIFKVFPDGGGGASDASLIKSFEMTTKLGLDVVNLSLGSDLTEHDDGESEIYNAIKKASQAGTVINFSAGNAGKASNAGTRGLADWTTDTVETGILGGEAIVDEYNNVVASSNPNKAFFESILLVGGTAISYSDQAINRASMEDKLDNPHPLTELLGDETSGDFEFVRIGGYGENEDYVAAKNAGATIEGKIAVVDRGSTTFRDKTETAMANKCTALVVINNVPGVTFNMNMDFNGLKPTIPVVFVFQSSSEYFGAVNTNGTLTLGKNTIQNTPDGDIYSSYSSDGPSYNLDVSPTIAAPGKEIIGAVNATELADDSTSKLRGYEFMSGTSMASPNLTGAMALVMGEKNPENNGELKEASAEAYQTYKKEKLSKIAMSNADKLKDATAEKKVASVRIQGAGRINARRILASNSYVTTTLNDGGVADAKAELKNTGTLNTDLSQNNEAYIEIPYTIHNDSAVAKTFTPSLSLMIPQLRMQVTHEEYDNQDASSKKDTPESVVGQVTMSINDDILEVPAANYASGSTNDISVAANATANGTMKVRIDNIAIDKTFKDGSTFQGTLREYYAHFFEDAGGSFIEGFVNFENKTEDGLDLSLPYVGFYGDYTKGAAVEPFDFEKKENHVYNSELVDNYMKNLNAQYVKNNAYVGSTLATHAGAVSEATITSIMKMDTAATKSINAEFQIATPIEGSKQIFAGAKGISDHIVAVFFVNRTIKTSSWSITDKNNQVIKSGTLDDMFQYSDTISHYNQGGALYKSWLKSDLTIHRGFADIDVNNIADGDYKLNFSFTPLATGTAKVNSYDLRIDTTAPEAVGFSKSEVTLAGRTYERVRVFAKEADIIEVNGASYLTSLDEATGLSYAEFTLTDAMKNNDSILITVSDYALNSNRLLVHPNDLSMAVSAPFVENKHDFDITQLNVSGGYALFSVSFYKANGNDYEPKSDYKVFLHIGAGLTEDQISVLVEEEEVEFVYDAGTGVISFTLPKTSTDFKINYMPVELGSNPRKAGAPVDPTSSSQPDSSQTSDATSSSQGGGEVDPGKKSGLKGWQLGLIIGGSVIGVGAIVAIILLILKKKKA